MLFFYLKIVYLNKFTDFSNELKTYEAKMSENTRKLLSMDFCIAVGICIIYREFKDSGYVINKRITTK